jgi:hypothetical protein
MFCFVNLFKDRCVKQNCLAIPDEEKHGWMASFWYNLSFGGNIVF